MTAADRSFWGALTAILTVTAAWLACVLASTFGWHPGITGPAAAILVIPLLACGLWLNRAAGKRDGEEPE